jgi:hypothetical protein
MHAIENMPNSCGPCVQLEPASIVRNTGLLLPAARQMSAFGQAMATRGLPSGLGFCQNQAPPGVRELEVRVPVGDGF